MRPGLRWVCAAYLAVVTFGVFGPAPGDELDRAGSRLRQVEAQVRDRVGTPTTAPDPSTAPSPSVTTAPPPAQSSDRLFDELSAEEFFNIVMFVPLGFLLPLCWPGGRWLTVPVGIALSSMIELVQGTFLSWRSQTLIDIQWNSLGAVLGFGVWLALGVVAPRLVERLAAQPSGNIPRRGSSV